MVGRPVRLRGIVFNPYMLLMEEKIFSWNCRGATSKDFMREMNEWRRLHKPTIILLIEPKINGSGANKVCRRLGKTHSTRYEAVGFSGGLWVLWDDSRIKVVPLEVDKSFIYAMVTLKNGMKWTLVVVYESPRAAVRRHMWAKLKEPIDKDPWLVMGDFDCVLRGEERSLG